MNERVAPSAERDASPAATVSSTQDATPEPAHDAEAPPARRVSRRLILMVALPVVLVVVGGYFWLNGGRYENTDNAYVMQSIVSVSPDISGRIIDVMVEANAPVETGDVLFRIDPEPYQIAVIQAEAALAASRINVDQLRVSYHTAQAKLVAAEHTLDIRQRAQDRTASLTEQGVTTQVASDNSLLALQQAQSDVDLSQQAVAAAVAALAGDPEIGTDDYPGVKTARAALTNARRNLDQTTVVAPGDGVVSQIDSLNVGQFVAAGTPIASLVMVGDSWVVANFKETQLGSMQVGQPVVVGVDTYGGMEFEGRIASIGAATGAQFSLIPAQNATGNWVKVVQRIPVRIELENVEGVDLRAGMSSDVTVDTGHTLLDSIL